MAEVWQPYGEFEGTVRTTFADSESWWPPRIKARPGNPNVVMIVVDDLGYSDLGCYGSEIDTPNIDSLAADGARYTNFHVTPLCSPTRASLLTGCESHSVGFGMVANFDPGFPGYTSELPEGQPTMAEVFRDNGYATFAIGKWHLCRDADMHEAANKHSWPLQRGFGEYYGFLEALTNFHHPHRMYRGNTAIDIDQVPDGYYLTDDLTDEAIKMVSAQKAASPDQPFFMYFAHGAVHAPLQAKPEDIAKYRGRYAMGWDELRAQRFAKQLEMGIVEPGVEVAPRNTEEPEHVVAWDTLSEREHELFARHMEVYAAMVDNVDQNVGRLLAALRDLGELDNTLVLFFSDNGASREGLAQGATNYFSPTAPKILSISDTTPVDAIERDHGMLDLIGGPRCWPHYPRGWAMSSNTPFRLYKMTGHAGGHQVCLVARWPSAIADPGGLRRQYVHVTDVLDTFADLFGFTVPDSRHGKPAVPRVGASFAASLRDPAAPTVHTENFIEVIGHRMYHRDGWEVVTFHPASARYSDDEWELFDLRTDPTQLHDLREARPDKLAELAAGWQATALANQTYPLFDGVGVSRALRPPDNERLATPTTILRGTPQLERFRSAQLIHDRSFRIVVQFGPGGLRAGDEGVLVAHGGQEGGYLLCVEGGHVVFTQKFDERMRSITGPSPLGATTITVDVDSPGGRIWNVRVSSHVGDVCSGIGFQQYSSFLPYAGIDVGLSRLSPVDWELHERHGTFAFSGDLRSVRYEPGALSPDAPVLRLDELRAMAQKYE